MATIEETKQYLNRAYRLEQLIKIDQKKIQELEEVATAIGGFSTDDRVQTSLKNEASFEKKVFNKDERVQILKSRIAERELILQEVDEVINNLDDNLAIEILSYRYLQFKSFREIAELTYYGVATCFRIHDKAVEKIASLIKNKSVS